MTQKNTLQKKNEKNITKNLLLRKIVVPLHSLFETES